MLKSAEKFGLHLYSELTLSALSDIPSASMLLLEDQSWPISHSHLPTPFSVSFFFSFRTTR